MTYHPVIIVDSGVLVAYYSVKDSYHQQARVFFERCRSNLITTTERLNIPAIATLDNDFDVYRRYRNQPFDRVFLPED